MKQHRGKMNLWGKMPRSAVNPKSTKVVFPADLKERFDRLVEAWNLMRPYKSLTRAEAVELLMDLVALPLEQREEVIPEWMPSSNRRRRGRPKISELRTVKGDVPENLEAFMQKEHENDGPAL